MSGTERPQELVQSLWVGNVLGKLELLTLHSFLAHGHRFRLWVYEQIDTPLPLAVELGDAREILPETAIFRYSNVNQFGHGKGSLAGFSDVFRYHLLYKEGGWWVDMDVTCLKPLETNAPYFFRSHHSLPLVGNVLKAPAKSALMKHCAEESLKRVNEHNEDWHLPIQILVDAVYKMGLESYVQSTWSNLDKLEEVFPLLKGSKGIPTEWRFIHWMNEAWRQYKVPRDYAHPWSAYHQLLKAHGLGNENMFQSLKGLLAFAPWQLRIR